jgi:HEAT repeat protein
LRRPAIELVESEASQPPPSLRRQEKVVFAALLANYARQLRGVSRERIAAYFETSGGVEEQTARLSSTSAWRRAAAAFALGDMGSNRAVPDLLRVLDDRVRDVRMAAVRSLGRIGATEAIGPLVATGVDGRVPREVANLALLDIGPAAVPQLVVLSKHTEPAIRASAVELIGLIGSAGDAEPILDLLIDPAATVRVATAGALGRLGASEARDALMRALDDRVPSVRVASASALGGIGGRQATAALMPIARNDTFDAARAAAEALARIDPRLVIRAAAEPGAGPHLLEAADRVSL